MGLRDQLRRCGWCRNLRLRYDASSSGSDRVNVLTGQRRWKRCLQARVNARLGSRSTLIFDILSWRHHRRLSRRDGMGTDGEHKTGLATGSAPDVTGAFRFGIEEEYFLLMGQIQTGVCPWII